jgi:hypothetical protein
MKLMLTAAFAATLMTGTAAHAAWPWDNCPQFQVRPLIGGGCVSADHRIKHGTGHRSFKASISEPETPADPTEPTEPTEPTDPGDGDHDGDHDGGHTGGGWNPPGGGWNPPGGGWGGGWSGHR